MFHSVSFIKLDSSTDPRKLHWLLYQLELRELLVENISVTHMLLKEDRRKAANDLEFLTSTEYQTSLRYTVQLAIDQYLKDPVESFHYISYIEHSQYGKQIMILFNIEESTWIILYVLILPEAWVSMINTTRYFRPKRIAKRLFTDSLHYAKQQCSHLKYGAISTVTKGSQQLLVGLGYELYSVDDVEKREGLSWGWEDEVFVINKTYSLFK